MTTLFQSTLDTPVGEVRIAATSDAIVEVAFTDTAPEQEYRENDLTRAAREQLEDYFAGNRRHFDLPLAPQGTNFQREAWRALQQIPYGETRHYAQQAQSIRRPKAVRAIGAANGANPIAIIVPCHRVIGKNGQLTGYAGGIHRKEWLLAFEQERSQELR